VSNSMGFRVPCLSTILVLVSLKWLVGKIDLLTFSSIRKHRAELNNEIRLRPLSRRFLVGHVEVDVEGETSNYPWRSNLQPVTGIVSLTGYVFLLIVVNGVSLWSGFHFQPFLGSYLAVSSCPAQIFVLSFTNTNSLEYS